MKAYLYLLALGLFIKGVVTLGPESYAAQTNGFLALILARVW